MKRLMRILPFMLLALFSAGSVYADNLGALFDGGSIVAGDKLFDSWQLINYASSDATRPFDAANIEVVALEDDPASPGLRFNVNEGELTVVGDGDYYPFIDLTFAFRVSTRDPGMVITGNSLNFLAYYSLLVDDSWDVGAYMRETIGTAPGLDNLAIEELEFSSLKLPDELQQDVRHYPYSAVFAPQNEIWITKNILVWAVDIGDSAGTLNFEQHFVQSASAPTIPEPSTLALMGLGIAGLAVLRRMRK
jgi:hypothetical protein